MDRSRQKSQSLAPLDKVGWLSEESDGFREWAATSGRWQRYVPGQVVYLFGDEPDGLYGLGHGTIDLSFPLEGVEPVSVHRAEPGFWIGESAFLSNIRRTVSVMAVTDTLLFYIPSNAIERRLNDDPESWHAFYRQSHANASRAVAMLAQALALSPRARLARLLLRLAGTGDDIAGTQESLGSLVGLRLTTAKRIFRTFVEAGAIRGAYGRISILDRSLLEAVANEGWEADETMRPVCPGASPKFGEGKGAGRA
jgi:CRP/FNR family cyclic AMP-dependent transcriptional regulator